jgi:tetratricopeptide (TPR) repeat protein
MEAPSRHGTRSSDVAGKTPRRCLRPWKPSKPEATTRCERWSRCATGRARSAQLEAKAWLALAQGDDEQALELMRSAAVLEDETDKSSLSPGRVLPVHEQLGDMLMELGHAEEAQREYEISLGHARERFNSIYGAARAAQAADDIETAREYYRQLTELTVPDSPRVELEEATQVLAEAVTSTE